MSDTANSHGKSRDSEQQPGSWEVVARTAGITNASIIAGRLKAEGIPVRIWQEGAGQALGLTVGLLGTGYVEVPESYVDAAAEILAAAEAGDLEDMEAIEEEIWEDDDFES